MMQKYRKKPVIIEAVQLTKDNAFEVYQLIYGNNGLMSDLIYRTIMESGGIHITTLEGTMKADFGDYIIKGVNGEFYPCKPDIFAKTYELVENEKKMVKLKFIQTHPTGSDETAPYDVILDKECTVREFIDAVLKRNEWGRIKIKNGSCIEYRRNEVISNDMTENDMACVINKVRASGGWSNMDYYLEIK